MGYDNISSPYEILSSLRREIQGISPASILFIGVLVLFMIHMPIVWSIVGIIVSVISNIILVVLITILAILIAAIPSCPEDDESFDRAFRNDQIRTPFSYCVPVSVTPPKLRGSYHFGSFRLIICELNEKQLWFLGMFNGWFLIYK